MACVQPLPILLSIIRLVPFHEGNQGSGDCSIVLGSDAKSRCGGCSDERRGRFQTSLNIGLVGCHVRSTAHQQKGRLANGSHVAGTRDLGLNEGPGVRVFTEISEHEERIAGKANVAVVHTAAKAQPQSREAGCAQDRFASRKLASRPQVHVVVLRARLRGRLTRRARRARVVLATGHAHAVRAAERSAAGTIERHQLVEARVRVLEIRHGLVLQRPRLIQPADAATGT